MSAPSAQLSTRERAVWQFVCRYAREYGGRFPTVREIGDGVDTQTPSLIHNYLANLVAEGLLIHDATEQARGYRIVGARLLLPGEETGRDADRRIVAEATLALSALSAQHKELARKAAALARRVDEIERRLDAVEAAETDAQQSLVRDATALLTTLNSIIATAQCYGFDPAQGVSLVRWMDLTLAERHSVGWPSVN